MRYLPDIRDELVVYTVIVVIQDHFFAGQLVDMRSLYDGAMEADITPAKITHEKEQNVRSFRALRAV